MLFCKDKYQRVALELAHCPRQQKSAGSDRTQMLQLKQWGLDALYDGMDMDSLDLNQFFVIFGNAQQHQKFTILLTICVLEKATH